MKNPLKTDPFRKKTNSWEKKSRATEHGKSQENSHKWIFFGAEGQSEKYDGKNW